MSERLKPRQKANIVVGKAVGFFREKFERLFAGLEGEGERMNLASIARREFEMRERQFAIQNPESPDPAVRLPRRLAEIWPRVRVRLGESSPVSPPASLSDLKTLRSAARDVDKKYGLSDADGPSYMEAEAILMMLEELKEI